MQFDGNRVTILSNIVASSAEVQAKYGGVIPEQAAREQLSSIIPVISEAINDSRLTINDIDAIAVTQGPGLIGSLLIGVETAKVLASIWQKPLIPVNHLLGHFYANWIVQSSAVSRQTSDKSSESLKADSEAILKTDSLSPSFPCLGLLVSGGHTDLVLFSDHGKYKYLGGTRDDAAGECFDKCARLLGLPYPGGPNLSKLAEKGNPKAYPIPRPMINSKDLDFSFSGLKTAVLNLINTNPVILSRAKNISQVQDPSLITTRPFFEGQDDKTLANLAASIEDAITDVLVEKTITAIQLHNIDQLIVAGGVAANKILAKKFTQRLAEIIPHARIFIPPPQLATDNAASIATAAFFNYHPIQPLELQANPNLSLA